MENIARYQRCHPHEASLWNAFNSNRKLQSILVPWVDIISRPLPREDVSGANSDPARLKEDYIKQRPNILADFNSLYDKRIQQGSKGRLVVWVVVDLDSTGQSGVSWVREFPLDLSNLCSWKHKYLPGIVRVAISESDQTLTLSFLSSLKWEYFKMPAFGENIATGASARSRSDLERLIQEQLSESKQTDSLMNDFDDVESKSQQVEKIELRANPSDITVLTRSFASEFAPILLNPILKLHKYETEFALRPNLLSHEIGSGGQLYLVADQLVSGISTWRRVDWLVMAQLQFLPRLWNLSDPQRGKELANILNYRGWLGRFSDLESLGVELVDYPDSKGEDILERLESGQIGSFNRKRRELDWSAAHLRTIMNSTSLDIKTTSNYDVLLKESNQWRISPLDFATWQELLICLQRTKNQATALEIIENHLRGKPKLPAVIEKLEALSLLKMDPSRQNHAYEMLRRYRQNIIKKLQDDLLLNGKESVTSSAQGLIYSEVAAVALVDGAGEEAREFALKALEKDKSLASAYKTLIWASVRTGKTSIEQEDLIFTFFVSYVRNNETAEEYYSLCTTKHPQVGIYKYAYAIFLQFILGDLDRAGKQYDAARELLQDSNARFLETYSTFLFQTRLFQEQDRDPKRFSKLKEDIESMYRKALKMDPDNFVIRGNLAAFLLATSTSSNNARERQIEAFQMLDTVLYGSGDLNSKNAALALEMWFYTVCYTPNTSKLSEALRHVKSLLRRKVRSPGWDLSMHLVHARRNPIIQSEISWIEKLSDVINLKSNYSELRAWPLWATVSADRLTRSPLKNSTGRASINIGSVLQPNITPSSTKGAAQAEDDAAPLQRTKTYSSRSKLTKASSNGSITPISRASSSPVSSQSTEDNVVDPAVPQTGFSGARVAMPSLASSTFLFDQALETSLHLPEHTNNVGSSAPSAVDSSFDMDEEQPVAMAPVLGLGSPVPMLVKLQKKIVPQRLVEESVDDLSPPPSPTNNKKATSKKRSLSQAAPAEVVEEESSQKRPKLTESAPNSAISTQTKSSLIVEIAKFDPIAPAPAAAALLSSSSSSSATTTSAPLKQVKTYARPVRK